MSLGRALKWVGLGILEVAVVCGLFSGLDSRTAGCCCKCAVFLKQSTWFGLSLPASETEPGEVTELIRASYPGPCAHEWIAVVENRHPCGNIEVWGNFSLVSTLKGSGVLESAARVDPRGTADLARCILRHGVPPTAWEALLAERGLTRDPGEPQHKPFVSRDEFRDWASRVCGAGPATWGAPGGCRR